MIRFQPSIVGKVRYGYYVCMAMIIIGVLVVLLTLAKIERSLSFSMVASVFSDTVLEMRRFEKNCFLYGHAEDYAENLQYTKKAENIIQDNKELFSELVSDTDTYTLQTTIREYKYYMRIYSDLDRATGHDSQEHDSQEHDSHKLEDAIREMGRDLVTIAENVSTTAREHAWSLLATFEKVLVISSGFLIITIFSLSQYLSHMVVKPLKQLEGNMRSIAEGRFDKLSVESSDIEIVSLSNAFNRMMQELNTKQMEFIVQSEKLVSLGTMISGIAHQINNPLSNVSTSCQILKEEIEGADIAYQKELLVQIDGEAERAKALARALLDFSRRKEFKTEPLPLKYLVENTVRLLRGDIPTKVEVVVHVPEDLWISADKQRMEHAIFNIIKNAVDSIPDEGRISVFAWEDVEAETTVIKIQDTGSGIEPASIKKIFEPFFTTKQEEKGTGLGLFVSHEIIKEHGGTIEVDSTEQGTTFLIKLPVKEH